MAAQLPSGFLAGYVCEMRSYLSLLGDSVRTLEADPADGAARDTVHRLVHIIRGSSGLVGMDHLSAMAACMETALARIPDGAALPRSLVTAMAATVERFDQVTRGLEGDQPVDQGELLASTREAFAASAGTDPVPESGGEAVDDADAPASLPAGGTGEGLGPPTGQPVRTGKQVGDRPAREAASVPLFSETEAAQLLVGFHAEAEEHLQDVQKAMARLEAATVAGEAISPGREEIAVIRRAVHTIKGASAVIGLHRVAACAHRVEDVLDQLHAGHRPLAPATLKTLATSLDLLGRLVASPDEPLADGWDAVFVPPAADAQAALAANPPPTAGSPPGSPVDPPPTRSWPAGGSTTLRIDRQRLDTLVGLGNDLLAGISGLGRGMEQFAAALAELDRAAGRLKSIAADLERVLAAGDVGQPCPSRFAAAAKTAFGDDPALDRNGRLATIIQAVDESAADAAAIHAGLEAVRRALEGDLGGQQRLARDLQAHLLQARLSPLATLVPRLRRTVEDVAARLGRQVRLAVTGERVELDRVVWEKLADPLMHLIRNAVHHGIEPAEERLARGKEAVATLSLSARREGDRVVILVADDGRGLDFQAIRDKARRHDPSLRPESMDERQLAELIFAPGFSTRTVSEVSGRGVGLDVVRANVRQLQGSVQVATRPGAGTEFVLRLPLTMGVVRALLVECGEALWAFALADVREVRRVDHAAIAWEEGTLSLDGTVLPWYSLPTLLGQVEDPVEAVRPLVLLVDAAGRTVAVSVPRVVGQQEIVLRQFDSQLGNVAGVAGAAVLGEGAVVPVLDPAELIGAAERRRDEDAPPVLLDISRPLTVLVVDDSPSVRRVVSRLITTRGWHAVTARDGEDAISQLAEIWPDCIVLDLEMPRLDGFAFLAALAAMPTRRTVPVIMMTSRTGPAERERAYQLGVRAFLGKPCRDEDLLAAIDRVTGMAGAGP